MLSNMIFNSNSHMMLLGVWNVASAEENFKMKFNPYI